MFKKRNWENTREVLLGDNDLTARDVNQGTGWPHSSNKTYVWANNLKHVGVTCTQAAPDSAPTHASLTAPST